MPISYRAAQNLIKKGDVDGLRTALADGLDPNISNENGWTLLMLAAVEGAVPIGKLLLEGGADRSRTNAKGATAESIATDRGFALFLETLNQ